METRLLESLHQKLGDLDQKLKAYRRDLAAQFEQHQHQVLRDTSPEISDSIRRTLALSLSDYPSLRPDLDHLLLSPAGARPESHETVSPGSATFQSFVVPPPAIDGQSDALVSAEANHEREKEFQGLFTPSYLPLLESSLGSPRSPPAPPSGEPQVTPDSSIPHHQPAEQAGSGVKTERSIWSMEQQSQEAGSGTREALSKLSVTPTSSMQLPERPSHHRQMTDETTTSSVSDRSEGKPTRSAMRRSSGSSKPPQSPRRVRFDFMGAEVLPTSSPQPSDDVTPRPSSPVSAGDAIVSDRILGVPEDDEPPPRKISSSDALRALSRTPLDNTVWTVVNPESDDTPYKEGEPLERVPKSSYPETLVTQPPPPPPTVQRTENESSPRSPLHRVHEEVEQEEAEDSEDSSDEEFLAMGKQKMPVLSGSNPATTSSPSAPAPQGDAKASPKASGTSQPSALNKTSKEEMLAGQHEGEDEVDELFDFEDGTTASSRSRPRPLLLDDDDEDEDQDLDPPENAADLQGAAYATSPAVAIAPRPQVSSGSSTPTTAKFQPGSLGSYKGRPVVMPVVRNPELHARAASLGEFSSFVGGLDGRSGMDEGDMNSFRASFVQPGFSGTPRSLTERMMMEEANRTGRDEEEDEDENGDAKPF